MAERLARRSEELKGQKSRPEIVNTMLDAAEKVFGWKHKPDGQDYYLIQMGMAGRLCPDSLKEKWAKPATPKPAPLLPRKDV